MRDVVFFFLLAIFCRPLLVEADVLETADGKTISGSLLRIAENQFTMQGKEGSSEIPATETIRVKLDSIEPLNSRGGMLILANDDRLPAELLSATDEALIVRLTACPEMEEVKVPLETVRAAFFRWPSAEHSRARLLRSLSNSDKKSDLFYLKNGDFLEGEFLGFDPGIFRFDTVAGETKVPRSGIEYFRFNPELINFPQPDQLHYRLTLIDGTRITVKALSLNLSELKAKTLFGAEFRCRQTRLASITPLGGRAVPLSQLEPAEYRFTPYLSQQWNWQRDRNVVSGPLVSGGQEYVSGLGMHSASELRFQLDGNYAAFITEVGLDDSTGERAAVEVQILVDGRVVFKRDLVRDENQACRVPRIDLSQAKQLSLKVDFGKNADMEDHLNWCRPVLIRKP